jgi:hypothetical protein
VPRKFHTSRVRQTAILSKSRDISITWKRKSLLIKFIVLDCTFSQNENTGISSCDGALFWNNGTQRGLFLRCSAGNRRFIDVKIYLNTNRPICFNYTRFLHLQKHIHVCFFYKYLRIYLTQVKKSQWAHLRARDTWISTC